MMDGTQITLSHRSNQKRLTFSPNTKKHDGKSLTSEENLIFSTPVAVVNNKGAPPIAAPIVPSTKKKPKPPTSTKKKPKPLTQAEKARHRQTYLLNKCNTEGVGKIGHPGIIRKKTDSPNIVDAIFAVNGTESQTFKSRKKKNILRVGFEGRKIFVSVIDDDRHTIQLVREDGTEILLTKGIQHELFRGDRVDVGSIKSNFKFVASEHYITHRAPVKQQGNQLPTAVSTAGPKRARKPAYPESRGAQDLREAKRVRKRVKKATAMLHKGKKTQKKERNGALSLIRKTALQRCPFEVEFGRCINADCPYLHKNTPRKSKEDYNEGDQVEAIVTKWHAEKGFGFARATSGVDFFFHKDQLKLKDSALLQGSKVSFTVQKNHDRSKRDRAIDVILK